MAKSDFKPCAKCPSPSKCRSAGACAAKAKPAKATKGGYMKLNKAK